MQGKTVDSITKISQVTPEVTLFLRELGFSNYYIIKIFDLVGEAAVSLTEDNPYWLLEDFPRMGFKKVDQVAAQLGMEPENPYRLQAAVEFGLRAYLSEGHSYAPLKELVVNVGKLLELNSELVEDVIEDMVFDGRLQLSDLNGIRAVYFYGYYKAECSITKKLAGLENPTGGLKPVGGNIPALIRKAETTSGIILSTEQKKAVENALLSGVSIITGGPGTGKTTIINAILSVLESGGMKVLVAAPTGRAAKRVMETSGHFACTVHRLLEYSYDEMTGYMRFGKNEFEPLDCQAVIIDEASMLDLLLAEALCDAILPGARLILVGDADQLPSVGAGNVLADLIDSEYFFTARLTEIYRQTGESQIIVNAHRMNRGLYPDYSGDFHLLAASKQIDILDKIVDVAKHYPMRDVQVLTPVKKGILGSANLNLKLQEVFNPPMQGKAELAFGSRIFRVGDKVMQIKNDYRIEYNCPKDPTQTGGKGIFNGEIGIVKSVDMEMRSVTVLFDDERWVEYAYVQLDELELAYAITIHKSQGSEFPVVILPMTWFPPILATRSLVYTAVTRGKKEVYIVGNPAYLNAMVDNNQSRSRNSGLKSRMMGLYQMIWENIEHWSVANRNKHIGFRKEWK